MNEFDYTKLAAAMQMMEAFKAPSTTPSNIYAHGPGGLFSPFGLRPGIANAMILPELGLVQKLPLIRSNEVSPLRGIFTGITDDTGNEPDNRCEDPPTAGVSKLCTTTLTFGWVGRSSRTLQLDRIGKIINRGETTDIRLMGDPFGAMGVPAPVVPGASANNINTEVGKLLFELAVSLLRATARDIYAGNPSNNVGTPENGGRLYYRGLDMLINTGYQDAITTQACPAADSLVRTFNQNISVAADGLIENITYMYRYLKRIAEQTGLAPVTWTIAMRWGLFYEITSAWPCAYQTYRCNLVGSTNYAVSSREALNAMTDGMRREQYLLIDGERVDVTIDDGIAETETEPGIFQSDIYFVPLRTGGVGSGNAPLSEGGTILTYMEYFDFDMPDGPMAGARALAPAGSFETAGGGLYLFHRQPPVNLCVKMVGWTQQRLVLETPYLAGRLTDLSYSPLIHERSAFSDEGYFANGGRTNFVGYGPSYNAPTS